MSSKRKEVPSTLEESSTKKFRTNPTNFFSKLSTKVLITIFSFLDDETLVRITRVCKQWKELIQSNFQIVVDFSKNNRWKSPRSLYHLRNIHCSNMIELRLRKCDWVTGVDLKHISTFVSLRKLDISGCKIDDNSSSFLSKLTNLVSIKFGDIDKHDAVVYACDITDKTLHYLSSLKKLQILDISGCEDITGSGFSSLTHLNIEKFFARSSSLADENLKYLSNWKNLVELDIGNCDNITDQGFRSFISSLVNLAKFTSICLDLSDDSMEALSKLKLRLLKLYSCPNITDKGMTYISSIRTLEKFEFENPESNPNITKKSICSFAKHPTLIDITFRGLPNLDYSCLKELSNVKKLTIHEEHINDDNLNNLPVGIEKLSLRNCQNISGKGLTYLLQYKHLFNLSLGGLPNIKSKDLEQLKDHPVLGKIKICWCDKITLASEEQFKNHLRPYLAKGGKIQVLWDDLDDVDDNKWYELFYMNGTVFVV